MPDGALILEAADALEVGGSGLPGWLRMCRRVCEARIVARQEPVEYALCFFEHTGLRESQFGDETILEGPEESFDPTFSLRRGGGNPANAQFLKGAPDLRGGHRASQLLCQGERGAGITVKQAMAIGVGRRGHAIASDEATEQEKVAVGIFLRAKDTSEDLSRSIIDRGVEDESGPAIFEPGMVTAIHLHEQAGLGHALTAATMPGWTALARTTDTGGAEKPLHGLPRHAQALALGQQFREVVIIHAGVGGTRQGEDPGADHLSNATRGGPSAVAVGQGRGALLPPVAEEPTEVAQREAQEPGRLPGAENAVVDTRQDMPSMVFPLGQRDRLPVHRVTYSLTH